MVMEKSEARKALERAYSNPQADWLNPDNHDKVHIALGLLSAESAEELTNAIHQLKAQVGGLHQTISTVVETQVAKMIATNEKLAISNEKYAKWNMRLTMALIATTLFVGLLQAGVLIWQTIKP